jgi:hypothetical protein
MKLLPPTQSHVGMIIGTIMITTLTKGTALYADDEGKVIVRDLPFPEPQDGDSLIKGLYSGVNLSYVPSIS